MDCSLQLDKQSLVRLCVLVGTAYQQCLSGAAQATTVQLA